MILTEKLFTNDHNDYVVFLFPYSGIKIDTAFFFLIQILLGEFLRI